METEVLKDSINEFFNVVNKLKQNGLFTSDKFLGDIGERVCELLYSLKLCESGREVGHDGVCEKGLKYQIKFHNSLKRTNIALGNPEKYDFVLVVIGPESKIKKFTDHKLAIYKFSSSEVKSSFKNSSGYSCGFKGLPSTPDKEFQL